MNFLTKIFMAGTMLLFSSMSMASVVNLRKDNMLLMNKEFTPQSVAELTLAAQAMDGSLAEGETIYLVMNSPGGSVFAGMELIQNLNDLKHKVETITIFAASMGFQTVQQLKGTRHIVPTGVLMSHKARGGFSGEFPGSLDEQYNFVLSVVTEMDTKVATRSGKYTLDSYRHLIQNEYWATPARSIKDGFADGVVSAICDKSLSGTSERVLDEMAMLGLTLQLVATMANCPTITAPMGVHVIVNGKRMVEVPTLTGEQREGIHLFTTKGLNKINGLTKKALFYSELR